MRKKRALWVNRAEIILLVSSQGLTLGLFAVFSKANANDLLLSNKDL